MVLYRYVKQVNLLYFDWFLPVDWGLLEENECKLIQLAWETPSIINNMKKQIMVANKIMVAKFNVS